MTQWICIADKCTVCFGLTKVEAQTNKLRTEQSRAEKGSPNLSPYKNGTYPSYDFLSELSVSPTQMLNTKDKMVCEP